MRISPISNNMNFKGVSIEAIDMYMKQNKKNEQKLKEFTKTVINEADEEYYNITFVKSLGQYAIVGDRIKRGFVNYDFRPAATFEAALERKNEQKSLEFSDDALKKMADKNKKSKKQTKQIDADVKEANIAIDKFVNGKTEKEIKIGQSKLMSVLYKYGV